MERKTPQEKKRLSLLKDRRNTYGENDKSSRKNIPRGKRIRSRAIRRVARQALGGAEAGCEPERADEAEARHRLKARKGWWKWPDEPLGEVLLRKLDRRTGLGILPEDVAGEKAERIRRRTSR